MDYSKIVHGHNFKALNIKALAAYCLQQVHLQTRHLILAMYKANISTRHKTQFVRKFRFQLDQKFLQVITF